MTFTDTKTPFPHKAFWPTLAINGLWINASEVFRYFAFVMGDMRAAFPQIENVAPMNVGVFMVWGVWDTILLIFATGFAWLWFEKFGYGAKQALAAGTAAWLAVFGLLWVGLYNMNLATLDIMATALPLAWIEQVVAALIVNWGLQTFGRRRASASA